MSTQNFTELNHFLVVAEYQSFAQAADKVGVSASAISHSIKRLEEKLGIRLFNRTTRSVTLTEAGMQLRNELDPLFKSIDDRIESLTEYLSEPKGTIKINVAVDVAEIIIYPRLKQLLLDNPKIKLDISIDNSFVDIISEGYDLGVRIGSDLGEGFVAIQVSGPIKMGLFASKAYISKHSMPKSIEDLKNHHTIGVKLDSKRNEMNWEFLVDGKIKTFTPNSRLISSVNKEIFNSAIKDGLGIGYTVYNSMSKELASGEVIEILPEYSMVYDPLFLYYPSRKGNTRAFKMIIEALRYQEDEEFY
ncbi:LysR family transcriptional regulator [Psittacicella gerlachiana]|uniref:HTH lysR-type domain-containing protein n=1 Tax=Psittacicella gerlachiana TaxID=2028574 RepID=A0A3A1YKK1_9GAMM|nr:LysR family transcriptional regulator [Psittacicella gerlachiana]RIY38712.1 hypothetical protein CKF59_00345 [Psittacicella gerlachiana]